MIVCSVFELTISLAWSTRAEEHLMIHQKSSTDFPTMSSQFSFIPFLYEIVGDSNCNNSTACKKMALKNVLQILIQCKFYITLMISSLIQYWSLTLKSAFLHWKFFSRVFFFPLCMKSLVAATTLLYAKINLPLKRIADPHTMQISYIL